MLAPSAASDPEERWLCYGSNAERVFGGDPIIVLARSRAHAGHATLEVIGLPTNTTTFEIDGLKRRWVWTEPGNASLHSFVVPPDGFAKHYVGTSVQGVYWCAIQQ